MPVRLHLLLDLLRRYRSVWTAAWKIRHQLDGPAKLEYELAFQPAHLELVETPVHPAPRWTARLLVLLTFSAILIACFAKLDIVATAKGKLVPDAKVKVIQPAITGVVREIAVHDGQRVKAGDLLVRLDTTQAAADEDKAKSSKLDSAFAAARAEALLNALQSGREPEISRIEGATPERLEEAKNLVAGTYREYLDKLSAARNELAKREAELDSTNQEIAKLGATAPLARAQANDYKALSADKYVARNDYLDKEQTALNQEHELAAQRSHAHELTAGIAEQRADIAQTASQFRREQLDDLEKATEQLRQSTNDETKAHTRRALLSLTSPVSGTVQQLATHTLGGVVTTAQALMEIVPDDAVEVEATVENKDVGFLKIGQRTAVKVDAFPYTRYGMLEGTVVDLSNDAVQDKKLGLAFTVRIRLKSNRMRIDDRWIALTPGMSVKAEIKTGKQTVAQYLLGPLVEGAQESMHER
ncbi:HlyD family type I secretion periplasmic adaptor subunit [Burkholderia cenocepacia]|uniref:HlyD family type I secretion periplasmic adaptor subunit n=1 Tax=Burkholderia cepacia complex TaxID=87882 RepID=UPI000F589843|nr:MULTISPECIES: HlyD family type I secretion periplasmic adaptor subunit [Burkholderia cepacia complex]ELW9447509.1 HlyD family type I secretion periplasmic adaptor subunit [Burkholderia cenocepacia]MBR8484349.1 HlyD family type I secretion periplasmic adaptor subunit [Burkholderia cenocepacia]MDN7468491.1 HlyD family type I secretion periplasmic adaptor subunit [Burkholderia orbicola]MDN7501434.1 HlyD family type I secretion periplasmic adaptor subunit [Burkholderia orbicola]RQU19181.1 HlyD 